MQDSSENLPLTLVAALGRNRAIGGQGRLLWRLRSDMRRFREITMGKAVIMGRKTWESIGKPLPGRSIVVVSRAPFFLAAGVEVAQSLADAIERANRLSKELGADEIVVAGGGDVYRQTLPLAARLRLTEVDLAPDADAFFPQFDPEEWTVVDRANHETGEGDEAPFAFVDYARAEKV